MLNVQGTGYSAVSYGVCEQLGCKPTSKKGLRAGAISKHVLDWWFREGGYVYGTAYGKRALEDVSPYDGAKAYVQQKVGFVWSIFLPFLINAVVRLVIDWLMSSASQSYRMAQRD